MTVTNPKTYLVLLRVEFSALGFGHYVLSNVLSTGDWKKWRFNGELPVPRAVNTEGQTLATTMPFEVE